MNIEALISKAAQEAVKALYGMDATEKMVQLQKTRSEFEGNLTLVVFPFVKAAKTEHGWNCSRPSMPTSILV